MLACSAAIAGCTGSAPAEPAPPLPRAIGAPGPKPEPPNLLDGTNALEPLEGLRGVRTDHVEISPTSIVASMYPASSAVYLAAEGAWYDLPEEETEGWLIHDLDLALIPEVLAAAPAPCEKPIVELRMLITGFGFMVGCGPADARLGYYFHPDGTPFAALDLTTPEGLQAALDEVVSQTEGRAESIQVSRLEGWESLTVAAEFPRGYLRVGRFGLSNDPYRKPLFAQQTTDDEVFEVFEISRVDGAGLAEALAAGAAELGIDITDPAVNFELTVYLRSTGALAAAVTDDPATYENIARPSFTEVAR